MAKLGLKYYEMATAHLLESAQIQKEAADLCMESILDSVSLITDVFKSGGKILLCGNGGSAADSQHMATEFTSRLTKDLNRRALPAISLTTDTSFLTAYSNDLDFDGIFERQIQALGEKSDLLIGFSTSGNSKNVILALKAAKLAKMKTLIFTGNSGSLKKMADTVISVPSSNTQYIQESHIAIYHTICELVEYKLFLEKKPGRAKANGNK